MSGVAGKSTPIIMISSCVISLFFVAALLNQKLDSQGIPRIFESVDTVVDEEIELKFCCNLNLLLRSYAKATMH